MVEIDGSIGEGGGQILRTALALSCLKQIPVRIWNIRKNRGKPGLLPQHLWAVRASAAISKAEVHGDEIGSQELYFSPGPVHSGNYDFDIGTAGSTTLLFQTILPALALANGNSAIRITGGTHNPLAPPFEYVKEVFLPMLGRLGIAARAEIDRYGFYPKGGGAVNFFIEKSQMKETHMRQRGRLMSLSGVSVASNLPLSIAERQRDAAALKLKGLSPEIATREVSSSGAGTFVFLLARYEGALCGFSSLGKRGKRAETVGEEAAAEFLAHHNERVALSGWAALDPHMADQIALYLALVDKGKSSFTTSRITEHLLTNLWVISRFFRFEYSIKDKKGKPGLVEMTAPSGIRGSNNTADRAH